MTNRGIGWKQTRDGWRRESLESGVPVTSTMRLHAGKWRLARRESWRDDGEEIDLFEGAEEACRTYDAFLDGYEAGRRAWEEVAFTKTFDTAHPGITIVVNKRKGATGGNSMVVRDCRHVGSYQFGMTSPLAAYMAGTMTICGSSMLDEELRGKGIGRAMYDAAASASGMDCVPHGSDFTPGELSPYSTAFWEKRRQRQSVPTNTPEAQDRKRFLLDGTSVPIAEAENAFDTPGGKAFLLALADVTGGRLAGVVAKGDDGEEHFSGLWVVLPDGRCMTARGPVSDREYGQMLREAAKGVEVTMAGFMSVEYVCEIENACRKRHMGWGFAGDNLAYDIQDRMVAVQTLIGRYLPEITPEVGLLHPSRELLDIAGRDTVLTGIEHAQPVTRVI